MPKKVDNSGIILEIQGKIQKILGNEQMELKIPPKNIGGDLGVAMFGQTPEKLAEAAEKIRRELLGYCADVKITGSYINIELRRKQLYQLILTSVTADGYGHQNSGVGQTVVIDYSSPNIAKPIGVGHLRSTIIGESLARIHEAVGYKVIRLNYLGDWGTQFGKLIYAYQQWGDEAALTKQPIATLKNLYIKFHHEAAKNSVIEDEARRLAKQLEDGDLVIKKLWRNFRDLSVRDFKEIYQRLDIKFDCYAGESEFAANAAEIIKDCLAKGLARRAESNEVVVENLGNLPSFLLAKQDNSTLYLVRDLASLRWRIEKFQPAVLLYVVGNEQQLHFQQLFALARRLNYLDNVEARQIGFGMVLQQGKKMSTRGGRLVELEELLTEAVKQAAAIIQEKNPELSAAGREEVAEIVATGAIIYNDIRRSRQQDIDFDWQKMLDFSGGSAVYLQYTYARIKSIIAKVPAESAGESGALIYQDEGEWQLARKMLFWPLVVVRARVVNSPHFIATYLEELAQLFNNFYDRVSFIGTEDAALRSSRLLLIRAVAQTIKKGLVLLAVRVAERI